MPELLALGATSLNSSKTMVPMGWSPILTLKNTYRCIGQTPEVSMQRSGRHTQMAGICRQARPTSGFSSDLRLFLTGAMLEMFPLDDYS